MNVPPKIHETLIGLGFDLKENTEMYTRRISDDFRIDIIPYQLQDTLNWSGYASTYIAGQRYFYTELSTIKGLKVEQVVEFFNKINEVTKEYFHVIDN